MNFTIAIEVRRSILLRLANFNINNMDQRSTFSDFDQLLTILQKHYDNHEEVNFLIDDNGLERMTGTITAIHPGVSTAKTLVTINTQTISLQQVVGVNGLFSADYTEC
jgi:hypothetical protein